MMELFEDWISQYGYWGLSVLLALGIVGLPIPDETLLVFAGYLIFKGRLEPLPTAFSALLGSVGGISISYVLGRVAGYPLLHKYGRYIRVTQKEIDRVHNFYHRAGGFSLTFGYYFAGVRHLTAFVAGASKLEYPIFAAFAYSGAAIWGATFLFLGYKLGERWREIVGVVHRFGVAAGLIIAVAAAAAVWWWWRRRAR